VLFLESCVWALNSRELFSTDGFHVANWSWVPVPAPPVALTMSLTLVLSSLMLALGLWTRFALILTLFLWSYFYGLDTINEKAAQTISIICMSILLFSACDNRLSLDNFLRRRRGLPQKPAQTSVFFLRLLQIEFAQIYFFSGISKMSNPDWVNGNAFYYILNSRWATDLGIFLSANHPDLVARIGGLGTILFELFQGLFLFIPPLRPVAIAMGVMFHTGIQLTLWIGTLGAHFILALVILFPEPESWAWLISKNKTLMAWFKGGR
jgi:uncharacterized membrane protein YphA (DoxX/SURF4 family)